MTLLSNPDPFDSDNPLKQMEDSTQEIHPGFWRSVKLGFEQSTDSALLGLNHLQNALHINNDNTMIPPVAFQNGEFKISHQSQKEELDQLQNKIDTYNDIKSQEKGFSAGAGNLLGNFLNPVFLGAGIITGGAADIGLGVTGVVAKSVVPKIATNLGGKFSTKVLTQVLPRSIKAGAFMAGGSLPSDVAETYNKDTDSINWPSTIKSAGENFGIGMAVEPFFPIFGKILKKLKLKGLINKTSDDINSSVVKGAEEANALTDSEQKLTKAYVEKESKEKLNTLANQVAREESPNILNKDGKMNILLSDTHQIKVLNDNMISEMSNDLDPIQKTPLSDALISSKLGEIVNNYDVNDSLEGIIHHVERQSKSFDRVLSNTLKDVVRSIKELPEDTASVSQSAVFKRALDKDYPGILPKNVLDKIRLTDHIENLNDELLNKVPDIQDKSLRNRLKESINNDIKTSKENLDKIDLLKYSDEIDKIQNNLFRSGNLVQDYDKSPDYIRLKEMIPADIKSTEARKLAAKIQLHADLNSHKGFSDIAKSLLDAGENASANFDKSDNAIKYTRNAILKKNFVSHETKPEDIEKESSKSQKEIPENEIPSDKAFEDDKAKEMLNSANKSIRQYKEMKDNKGIFDELNNCMQENV
jgi:hypothetical protein